MLAETLVILALALLVDRIVGDPERIWRRLPHPVVLFGSAIAWCDRHFNRPTLGAKARRLNGIITIVTLITASAACGWILHLVFSLLGPIGMLLEAVAASIFLAQKSLADHVARVADGLRGSGLEGGRKAVSMIVGRDPETLDGPGVCRAAIESLAENFSDGVVAPAFWFAILGLPGLLAYKMLNTADSMIGHRSERYLSFGWAAARLDDIANLPAARLSVPLIAVGALVRRGWHGALACLQVAWRDHGFHRSPNSGWPEAAMAGALAIQLAGPRIYAGALVDEPMLNAKGRDVATRSDITKAVEIFLDACATLLGIVLALAVLTSIA